MRKSIKLIVIGGFAGLALAGCKQETTVPADDATATEVVAVPGATSSSTTVVPVPGPTSTSTETVVVPVPGATVTETATPAPKT